MKKIAIIGAGVAGLEAGHVLAQLGHHVTLIEQKNTTGGNVRNWDRLFPNQREAIEVYKPLVQQAVNDKLRILTDTVVMSAKHEKNIHRLTLSNGETLNADAVLISTGFRVFDAHRKEEYGYGIYHDVITSADLEKIMATSNSVRTTKGQEPKRVAFVHCVGSRDEKVGNTYCSKVCCVTAVKQAIEIKQMYPDAEVFCLYMDLRMYDRYFEDLYREAQEKYGVTFIRGRLSEVAESFDGRLQIKTEDTLRGKPLKFNVDMLVLMTGMEPPNLAEQLATEFNIHRGEDRFFTPEDEHINFNLSRREGVFLAGTCKGPKNIAETIADARSAADAIINYLK